METTYSNLMLRHGFPKSLFSFCRSSLLICLYKKQCAPCSRNPSEQCMFIFIDSIAYLWLEGMRMQEKPQMLQVEMD
jgi:hypothetical protein